MDKMRVRLTLIDEMLGTAPGNEKIFEDYIASNAPDAPSRKEEIAAIGVAATIEKGMTVFPRDEEGNPILWNYQIKGFFKSACKALKKFPETRSAKIKAYKQIIDLNIFVFADATDPAGRMIKIHLPEGGVMGNCQRPLRAQTMQGERVTLANSETVPKGSYVEFDIVTPGTGSLDKALIEEWLEYGMFNGLNQWRNAGKGAFSYEVIA